MTLNSYLLQRLVEREVHKESYKLYREQIQTY